MPDTNYTITLPRVSKALRVFRLDFICDDCDHEWTMELLTVGADWCPCCDRLIEPYLATPFLEETDEED